MTQQPHPDYIVKRNFLSDIKPDQTILLRKSILPLLPGTKRGQFESSPTPAPADFDEWYPAVNSYYPFTEDVDAVARVHHLLESKKSSDSIQREGAPCVNEYGDKRAHHQYLRSKPTCFLILGKPGLGEEEIGRRLAGYWKCVYIDPLTLLEDEIASDSRPGQCIEFNLRSGRAVGVDVLMRLLVRRVQHPDVQHRGFVCCGFPLIHNDLYEEDPISSESAVFNVREIFEEIVDQTLHLVDVSMNVAVSMIESSKVASEGTRDEQADDATNVTGEIQMSMDWSLENPVCGPADISQDVDKQLSCLFGLFEHPFIIVYLHGRNSDVISKRDNYYFDVYSNDCLDMQKIELFYEMGAANEDLAEDLFGGGRNPFADNPSLRHLVKHPENLPANVRTQLDRYHNEAVNAIDCKILQHKHQYYIKLDSRCFLSQMINMLKLRLRVLPLQPVLIPREFSSSAEELGEGSPETTEPTPEEAFLKLCRQDIVSPVFKWVWSDWGSFCPVSMSETLYQKGSPKYAVHFTNRIYFMADERKYQRFRENPRPFLLPPFPKPGSNVLLFGPPVSGKSAVAKCLGYLLNSKVLTPGEMHREYLAQAFAEFQEQVKQVAIAEAMEILKEKQIETQKLKRESVAQWEDETHRFLTKLIFVLDEASRKTEEVMSSFPMMIEQGVKDDAYTQEELEIREKLVSLNLPMDVDRDLCEQMLKKHDVLFRYLPDDLKPEERTEPPSVHDPFVLQYVEKKVSEIDLDEVKRKVKENVYDMYARSINAIEDSEYYGWVIDGMANDATLIQQLCAEFPIHEVVILSCSNYKHLVDRFNEGDKHKMQYRDFRNFFLRIGERDAAYRAPSFVSTDTYKMEMAGDLLSKILGGCFDEEVIDGERELSTRQYQTALEAYEEEVKEVVKCVEDLQMHYIVIDVQNLSIEELLEEVFYSVQDKYRRSASEFTDADRAEELQQFMAETIPGDEGERDTVGMDILASNRRYGDTYYYCPVAFAKHFVLRRGKEEFAAKFKEKVYLCANEKSMKDFVKYPRKHLTQVSPPDQYPPPRVCIISADVDLRGVVAQKLARNMAVRYANFEKIKRQAINLLSNTSLLVDPEGEDLPETLLYHWYEVLLTMLWFEEPYKHSGFVFNGFPVKPRCLNYMLFLNAVPDVIVHLARSREENVRRQVTKFMDAWREDVETQRKEEERANMMILQEWEEKRKARYDQVMEVKRQNRYSKRLTEDGNAFASDTQISVDSVTEQRDHDETMRILDEEYPEPVFSETQESEEVVIEKYTAEIEAKYDKFMRSYEEMKETCEAELIPFVEIDGDQELERVIRHAYIAGNEVKFRGNTLFERCYDVSLDVAEKLLSTGYYFLSFFGRICPVQYSKGYNPLHMFVAGAQNNTVFPLIHRQHIYFLHGKTNRAKFIKDPLRYTTITNFDVPLIPVRIAVVGPPKSGKTTLADRFRRDLGFRLLSRGQAVRYALNNPLCTNLRDEIEGVLRRGEELTDEMVMDCVHLASFCGEDVTQGLVFDGFPNSVNEMNLLARLGLVPHLIFDLQITEEQLRKQAGEPRGKYPQFSGSFVRHLHARWSESQAFFRTWCDREYQNIYKLRVDRSVWGMWNQANEVTLSMTFERKHYYKHVNFDWPLRVAYMLVTPLEFLERQSQYKTFCPVCFFKQRKLMNGGDPPDRTGLVQYGKKFYWLCEEHVDLFLENPDQFLPPGNLLLPPELPEAVTCTKPPKDCVENGYCLVCYRGNFPKKVLQKGTHEFVVSYKNKYYMFDSLGCLTSFMAYPEKFFSLVINFKDDDQNAFSLEYRDLPVLGMLEQYLAGSVVKAVNSANVNRPVIPGLSIAQAAAVFVGLNLMVDNPKNPKKEKYEEGMRRFNERMADLGRYLEVMKRYLNPMVCYEEPDTPSSTEVEVDSDEEVTKLKKVYSSMI